MKYTIISWFIVLFVFGCKSRKEDLSLISFVEIIHPQIKQSVEEYVAISLNSDDNSAVYLYRIQKSSDTTIIYLASFLEVAPVDSMPSAFSVIDSKLILFYNDFSPYQKIITGKDKPFDSLLSDFQMYAVRTRDNDSVDHQEIVNVPPTYNPPVWKLYIYNNTLVDKSVVN